MASYSFQLTMLSGPNPGKVYPLDKAEISIGRDESKDIFILEAGVSRRHARLVLQGTSYVLEDLGSTNGTFVNDRRLTGPCQLQPNDVIMFGDKVRMQFVAAQQDVDATVEAAAQVPNAPRTAIAAPPPQRVVVPQAPPAEYGYQRPVAPRPAAYASPAQAATKPRLSTPVLVGGLGCLVLLCLAVLGILWYIDANYLWCTVMPFIPGC